MHSSSTPRFFERFEPTVAATPAHRVLVIDNHDSFTYNLVQFCLDLGAVVYVITSDRATLRRLDQIDATHWIVSPGPGRPEDAGLCPELWTAALDGQTPPILGVCLGHQGLCLAAGAKVGAARRIMHGKVSAIHHDGRGVFAGLPTPMTVARYHSLAVHEASLPVDLKGCAWTLDSPEHRELMAVAHSRLPLWGVQFHPESIASDQGHALLRNFLASTHERMGAGMGS